MIFQDPRQFAWRRCKRLVTGSAAPFLLAAATIAVFHGFASSGERLVPPPPPGTELHCEVTTVLDGDTVDLACPPGRVRLRLWGIDAPETDQRPWGKQATRRLELLLDGAMPAVRVLETDIYNRAVGVVLRGGDDVGLRMVSEGFATVRTRYVTDDRYRAARSLARQRGVGIWSEPGLQQQPWEWRRLNPR